MITFDRPVTETLPWGAVRVAGRNRPDTFNNPYSGSFTARFLDRAELDAFESWYIDTLQEGSLPFEIDGITYEFLSAPTYSQNTGLFAIVSMQLQYERSGDYCDDKNYIAVLGEFGDLTNYILTQTAYITNELGPF